MPPGKKHHKNKPRMLSRTESSPTKETIGIFASRPNGLLIKVINVVVGLNNSYFGCPRKLVNGM